jgi:hypothetical protein
MVEFMQQGTTITSEVYCELRRDIHNKSNGMLTYGVVLHDNALPHTAARTRARLEHLNWELFDHSPYNPDPASSAHYLFTLSYAKNWLESQSFNNNEKFMEGFKTWLRRQTSLIQAYKNLFPDTTNASTLVVTTSRSCLSVCIFCIQYFSLIAYFVKSSLEVTFRIALVILQLSTDILNYVYS